MTVFWRILLAFCCSSLGLMLGGLIGARFLVSKADGLAGGVMVLWYGVLGALALLVIGIILGSKLRGTAVRMLALSLTGLSVILYGVATYKVLATTQAELGTDSEYEAAGEFTATMERLDISDPYLFVKIEINSPKRMWTQTGPAPDHDTYYARMNAKTLLELRLALNEVAAMKAEQLADCQGDKGPATRRLQWDLKDAQKPQNGQVLVKKGAVDINDACLREHFIISRALRLVEKASQAPGGRVKRE